MGRWAQARRRGGGPPILNYITRAQPVAADRVRLHYRSIVSETDFTPTDFTSEPAGTPGDAIVQVGPTLLDLTLLGTVGADTELLYSGATPGVVTPQTVLYT